MNKTVWRFVPVAILAVGSLLGCTMVRAAPQSDRMALEAAMQRWTSAVNARDVNGLTAIMTDDVELLDANAATVTGRAAAIGALRDVAIRGKLVAASREITIAGDIAWRVVGLAQRRKDGVVHARGPALEIWKRVDGEWKLHRQMAGLIAQAEPLTRPPTSEPVLDRPVQ
jgi:ketosteroid isomerase-like protein